MNIIRLISQSQPLFSDSEWRVAQTVLNSPEKVQRMTIENLAQAANVSTTTVIRFYKTLNQSSFSEFKVQLSMAIAATKNKNIKIIDDVLFKDLEKNDSVRGIADKLISNTIKAYKGTVDRLSEELIDNISEKIHEANDIFVYGVGASAIACENMVQKWNRIGKRITFTVDLNTLLMQLTTAKKSSLVFLISNSGESPEVIYVAKFAKERKLPIISLTEPSNNALSKLSAYQLQTAFSFEGEYRIAATTSLSTQSLIINILFYRYVNMFEENYSQKLKSTHDSLQKYKREINFNRREKG